MQGEDVKKLDVVANEIFINCLQSSGKVAVMVSEENEEAIFVHDSLHNGQYSVVFDPLDGSSNIDAGVSIGTIFGIYQARGRTDGTVQDVLRPGREMVAAGYAMYGSFTILVLATAQGVNGYTLDPVLPAAPQPSLTVPCLEPRRVHPDQSNGRCAPPGRAACTLDQHPPARQDLLDQRGQFGALDRRLPRVL